MIAGLILVGLIMIAAFGAVTIERVTRRENSSRNDSQFMWGSLFTILGLGACVVDIVFAFLLGILEEMGLVGWLGFLGIAAIGRYNVSKSESD